MPHEVQTPNGSGGAQSPRQPAEPRIYRYLPGLALLRDYRRQWILGDLIAGASVCIIMIPSVIAYAGLMGLRPQHGLYAALVPLLVYTLLGSSRQMIVGPDIAISLLTASTVAPLAAGNPDRAAALAAAMALLSGLLLFLGARANLGAVATFFKPVLVGYMTGAALILIASQLDKLFGVKLKSSDFFPRLAELGLRVGETQRFTFLFGLALLVLLVCLRRWLPRIPAPMVACVIAIVASISLNFEQHGIAVVGSFPRGLPALAVPDISWRDLQLLAPAAIGIALLTYTEGILLARAFAAKNGYEDSSQPGTHRVGFGRCDDRIISGLLDHRQPGADNH